MEELQKDILNCFLAYAIHADSPKEYAFRGFVNFPMKIRNQNKLCDLEFHFPFTFVHKEPN